MKTLPFSRKLVQRGDLLAWSADPSRRLLFRFMGHNGTVVATWLEKTPGKPLDIICLQREVRRLVSC